MSLPVAYPHLSGAGRVSPGSLEATPAASLIAMCVFEVTFVREAGYQFHFLMQLCAKFS